jgi:glycosyltransferase involved in cell wall biosynthesis
VSPTPDTERVRVLLIAPPPEIVGGQSVQALRLRRALARENGVEVTYLPFPPEVPAPLKPLQRPRYVRTIFNSLAFQAKLLARLRKVDAVHVFTPSFFAFMWAPAPTLALARLFGRKSVLNYRDGRAEDHLREWKSARRLIALADVVVAPSEYLVDVFARYDLPVRSIHNVIDASAFRYRRRTRLRPKFLHNRGLESLYNVACTLRAFALIQQRYPEASLVVTSDGTCREQLERLAEELALEHVHFVGAVSQEEMTRLYDDADIYLNSPDLDCMPGSILECYASGLPIVSTRAGGIPYILFHERTGLLVDLDDHQAMAQAAFRLLEEDGLAQRLADNAREELSKYDSAVVSAQWVALYQELDRASRGSNGSGDH